MTVKELIEELRKLPEDGVVLVHHWDMDRETDDYVEPDIVEVVEEAREDPKVREFVL